MADLAVKPEIKLDPSESKDMADIEEYEEDTDLQIPANPPQGWLARVPQELWQAWSTQYKDAAPDQPIRIGTLRVHKQGEELGAQHQKLEIFLKEHNNHTSKLPQKYNLKVNSTGYPNSVVFSEKDLPGHKTHTFGRGRPSQYNNKQSYGGISKPPPNKKLGGYASAIPKQTALAAKIAHECNLIPQENDSAYLSHLERTLTQAMAPKVGTTFNWGIDRAMAPGLTSSVFNTFTTSSKPTVKGKGKKKNAKEKYVRMDTAQLFDRLQSCFRRYRYWSLKALRLELKQPEAFVKTNVEQIATLIRSGDFAMQYMLKPEYAQSVDIKNEEVPEEAAKVESGAEGEGESGESDESGDDDEDLGDLEDVKMEH